jgi:hypothetical protein
MKKPGAGVYPRRGGPEDREAGWRQGVGLAVQVRDFPPPLNFGFETAAKGVFYG